MDISKLEALACLRLDPTSKEDIAKSLDEVVQSLQGVTKIDVESQPQEKTNPTVFREQEFMKPKVSGLNLTEEGYFLAPKVIKKD